MTKTASLSSLDLHCLCVTWEMFTSHQTEKIETSRSVLVPWAELQRPLWMWNGSMGELRMDEAAGPCCQFQHVKPCPLLASCAGCSQSLEEKSMLHPSLFLPLRAQESRTPAEPDGLVATYSRRQCGCAWLGGTVQLGQLPPSKDSLACGCSRTEAAASNHCSKNLPKPALNEVTGALEVVQLFSFIPQGCHLW